MPPSSSEATEAPAARPYGLFGLLVSTFVIFVTAAVILLLIAAIAFGVLAAGIGWKSALQRVVDLSPTADPSEDFADRINIIIGGMAYVVTACAVLIVARFRGGVAWADLIGWHSWDMGRHFRLISYLLAGTLCYSLLASSVIERFYPEAKDWVPTPSGTPWIIGFLALATLLAPITEELLFRGWLHTSLRERIGVWTSIVATSILFALAHWEKTHLYALAVFPVGLVLAYIRERTGSLAASMTCHAAYNGAASVLLVFGF